MKLNNLVLNAAKLEAGQWIENIPECDNLRLKVRGLNTPSIVSLRARKERAVPNSGKNSDGTLKEEVALRIFGETAFEAVLIDWENFEDQDGNTIRYTKEFAKELCLNPDYRPFLDAVTYAAQVADRMARGVEETKELVKNSEAVSGGRSRKADSTKETK